MKRIVIVSVSFVIAIGFLVGCSPSEAAIQTAIAKTQIAQPTKTEQLAPTNSPTVTVIPLPNKPTLLNSLQEFENSQFCQIYRCKVSDSWLLKAGGTDNTYDTNIPNVIVEINLKVKIC